MSNIGQFITFLTATNNAICWPYYRAIPRFWNSRFEGSLISGILSKWLIVLRKTLFLGFFDHFSSCSLLLDYPYEYKMPFLQKEPVQ